MAYWRDNADSYVCSACGYECNNPNKLPHGPGVCPSCQSMMSAGGISAPLTGWISVKERMPEMGEHYQSEDVLVCIDYRPDDPGTTEDTYVSIDHVDFNCFGQGEFSCERDDPRGGEPSPYFVTHWMLLPEPPEEGTT